MTSSTDNDDDDKKKNRNILYLYNAENCWENRINEIISFIDGRQAKALCDIPAFTRILVELPRLRLQFKDVLESKSSRNQVEIIVSRDQVSKWWPNHQDLIQVFTPLTRTNFGAILPSLNSNLNHFVSSSSSPSNFENCVLIVNCFDNWQLQLYTQRHIKLGEYLQFSIVSNIDIDGAESKSNQEGMTAGFSLIQDLLPLKSKHLAAIFYPLLIQQYGQEESVLDCSEKLHKIKIVRRNVDNDDDDDDEIKPKALLHKLQKQLSADLVWREFLLYYCIRILTNPNCRELLAYKSIQEAMIDVFGQNCNDNPILLTSLALEGSFNSKLNPIWYKQFFVKSMMALSQTKKMTLVKNS